MVLFCVVCEPVCALFVDVFVRCLWIFLRVVCESLLYIVCTFFVDQFLRCLLTSLCVICGSVLRYLVRCLLTIFCVVCGPVCALFVGHILRCLW